MAYATIVNGTILPSVFNGNTADRAFDSNLFASGANIGAWASSSSSNSMQFALSATMDNVTAVYLYAGNVSMTSSSGFLSVYLSQTTNYSDPATAVTCARGVAIIAGKMGAVTCPKLTGVNYVRSPGSPGRHSRPHACGAHCQQMCGNLAGCTGMHAYFLHACRLHSTVHG